MLPFKPLTSKAESKQHMKNLEDKHISKHVLSLVCDDHTLTWLPDTFRSGQGVTVDAFVPQTSEPVNDTPTLVQHRALHFILVRV